MTRTVACPVALHPDGAPRRLPVLAHPKAGMQLVRSGLHGGERPEAAAARELFAASGLETRAALSLGQSTDIHAAETWHFVLCRVAPPVRARWQHAYTQDGGQLVQFQWMTFDEAGKALQGRCLRALEWIRDAL